MHSADKREGIIRLTSFHEIAAWPQTSIGRHHHIGPCKIIAFEQQRSRFVPREGINKTVGKIEIGSMSFTAKTPKRLACRT
jgi:hypothetical protein